MSAIFDFPKRKRPRAPIRTFSERSPKISTIKTKIARTFFFLFLCESGNWEKLQRERRSAEAMNRSIGRLAGIASVFSRGFRSTASVTMPMKVRFSGYFHLWRENFWCVPFFAALLAHARNHNESWALRWRIFHPISHFSNVYSLVVSFYCNGSADY